MTEAWKAFCMMYLLLAISHGFSVFISAMERDWEIPKSVGAAIVLGVTWPLTRVIIDTAVVSHINKESRP